MASRDGRTAYILCADILGFSDIVRHQPADKLNERLRKWINAVDDLTKKYAFTRVQHFSDTLFVSVDSDLNSFGCLLEFSRSLLSVGIEHSFPIRGGIAHGIVVWDDTITFGPAVIAAHQLEQESDWIGITCANGCPHAEALYSWDLLVVYAVPRRTGIVSLSSVVAWSVPSAPILDEHTLLGVPTEDPVRWESQHTKVLNTIVFGKYLRNGREQNDDPKIFSYISPSRFLDQLR